ncbi:MAG: SUMF1/EgtB/PvdO family nonheme iron enzyme, partial [Treponema sp.]|nr:SUMF1/EgtB/PvdO family nonheme iron enzyme [Treponema sp.]
KTHEVMKLKPNDYGLYDMSGNVFEWCWDWYGNYTADAATDPTGAAAGSARDWRGGSWDNTENFARASYRLKYPPEIRSYSIGFRVVRTVTE